VDLRQAFLRQSVYSARSIGVEVAVACGGETYANACAAHAAGSGINTLGQSK
jgi:hypothetical protein